MSCILPRTRHAHAYARVCGPRGPPEGARPDPLRHAGPPVSCSLTRDGSLDNIVVPIRAETTDSHDASPFASARAVWPLDDVRARVEIGTCMLSSRVNEKLSCAHVAFMSAFKRRRCASCPAGAGFAAFTSLYVQSGGLGPAHQITPPHIRPDRALLRRQYAMQAAGWGLMRFLVKIIHGGGTRQTAPPSFPWTNTRTQSILQHRIAVDVLVGAFSAKVAAMPRPMFAKLHTAPAALEPRLAAAVATVGAVPAPDHFVAAATYAAHMSRLRMAAFVTGHDHRHSPQTAPSCRTSISDLETKLKHSPTLHQSLLVQTRLTIRLVAGAAVHVPIFTAPFRESFPRIRTSRRRLGFNALFRLVYPTHVL